MAIRWTTALILRSQQRRRGTGSEDGRLLRPREPDSCVLGSLENAMTMTSSDESLLMPLWTTLPGAFRFPDHGLDIYVEKVCLTLRQECAQLQQGRAELLEQIHHTCPPGSICKKNPQPKSHAS